MKKILFVLLLSLVFLAIITTQGCFLFRVIKLDIVTKNISLSIGESKTIQLTVKPIDTTLKFTSKNTSIATVSDSGTVTGISAGETEIEIEASKDKYKTVTKTVSVTVLAPSTYTVTFSVSDNQGAVQGANVAFNGENKSTDAQGKAVFTEVLAGSKAYTVSKEGYNNASGNINVDGDENVDITLTKKTYTIAATAGAGGSIGPSGEVEVSYGDSITFSILPDDSYTIEDVISDGVTIGPVDNYTYTKVTSDHTIHAAFRLKTYTLTTNTVGQGTVTKNPSKPTYDHGEEVELTATPDEGWSFVGWSGDLSGTANPANIAMDSNKTVTATFTIKKYTIAASANPPAGGTITGAGSYDHGDTVDLVAAANEGYEFVNWTENGVQVSTNAAYSFMATANRTLVANFRLKTYTITATAGAGGSINPSGDVSVNHGDDQEFAITPGEGYNVEDVLVDGESVGPRTSYTFTGVAADHTIHASFSLLPPPTYTVTFNVSDNQGAVQGASVTFYGETKATDVQGKAVFTGVLAGNRAYTVSKTGYNNATGNVNVDGDETVNVILTKKTYTITATAGAGGNINPAGSVQVEHGSNRLFNITPNTGYEIEDVKVDGVSIGAVSTYNFTNVTTNHTIHATFQLKSYTIVVSANPPAGGSVSGGGNYTHGDTVNLVAAANEGYEFVNWTENGVQVSTNAAYSFTATANRTLVANFRLKTYTITATAGTGGSINPAGSVNVTHGSNQSFTITPDTGYDIEDVKVDGVSIGAVSSYTFNNVTASHTISVTFKLKTYSLTTNVIGQGTVTKNPDKATYTHGEVVQLTANPSAGWAFDTWSGDLSGSANPANLTMNGNKTVTADFVRVYTVTFNVSDNQGKVQGANVAFNGENKSTDAQGKAVFTNVQSGTRSYTISKTGYNNVTDNVNVDGDKTVDIILTKKTYTIAVSANPAAGGTAAGGGVYTHGDTVNLSATPKEGYRFVNWTENGAQVSTNASYSFTATKNRTLVANFTTISKGTIQINNTTMDGFGQIDIYAEDFEFGVTAIEYVLSFDTTKLSVLAMSNDAGLGWPLANMIRNTDGIIHFIAGGQPVNLAGRTKIATIVVSEISSGSTTIGFTSYVYNDSPVETAVADDSQPPQEIRSPNITLIPGTITIN
ncbi:conserved protein of unknown function [Mesotoga infera]|uniref:BIG2 domain-containing protein n=1 Tax=Mesotoga infera TaxID=1236046 RepID=A0A7Z7PS02_9BACT|nr:Ig-like domain-containing protein [Mesotoga infera]SSC13327.1 conserved protein of unknown function [Mesotoga infera]